MGRRKLPTQRDKQLARSRKRRLEKQIDIGNLIKTERSEPGRRIKLKGVRARVADDIPSLLEPVDGAKFQQRMSMITAKLGVWNAEREKNGEGRQSLQAAFAEFVTDLFKRGEILPFTGDKDEAKGVLVELR